MSVGVLFVCMGNICRSPTAHGVFQQMVEAAGLSEDIRVDSAGTHDYHPGKPPDPRSRAAAHRRGYDLSRLRARQVRVADFEDFEYVLAMDQSNYFELAQLCPAGRADRLRMFLSFAEHLELSDVPDPYFGTGEEGFEHVLDLVETACEGLLEHLRQ